MDPFYWALLLLALGLATIGLELFVPSAGLLGVLAFVLIVSAIIVGFFSDNKIYGLVILGLTAVALPGFIVLALKVWPNTPIGRRVLIRRVTEEDVLPVGEHYDGLKNLIGKEGVAKTKMLPSGMVKIDGRQYDAITDGFAVDPGDRVRVIAIRTHKIIVQKVDDSEEPLSDPNEIEDILSKPIDDVLGE